MICDYNGNFAELYNYKLAGVVLDASSEANRYLAMKQLFDIAEKKLKNPAYTPEDSEYTYASKGCVCLLPRDNTAMYGMYPFQMLYAKDEQTQAIPASTTKVVSLVTALPYIKSIKDKVTIESSDVTAGSGNLFGAGDIMTYEDLFLGMMIPSSNTCATALAHNVGKVILGNDSETASDCINAFIAEMNKKAAFIGCNNSVFDSPSGLSQTNKTTALDMLRFLIEACSYPEILRCWIKRSHTIHVEGSNERDVEMTSSFSGDGASVLEEKYQIMGGKTGHLSSNADALVMIAEPKA